MSDDQGSGWTILKGVLLLLGAFVAIGIVAKVVLPLIVLGVLAAAGFAGYKFVTGGPSEKALRPKDEQKALAEDMDKALKELESLKKKAQDRLSE